MAINRVKPLLLTSKASSTVSSSYAAINPNGTEGPVFFLRIVNNSTQSITISFDGINDNEFLLTNTSLVVETQTNAAPAGKVALFPIGLKVYIKGTAGTGSVYLSGYYQPIGE